MAVLPDLATRASGKKPRGIGICAIDVFCGAGGLTNGLKKAGVDVRVGIDNDPFCEYPYTFNNEVDFYLKDIKSLQAKEISHYLRKDSVHLVAGCAPCQPFSTYTQKTKKNDSRWRLLYDFAKIVKNLSPHLVTMENVAKVVREKVFSDFIKNLNDWGYFVNYKIVNCSEFGIPQKRRRLVLLASKLSQVKLLYPKKFEAKSITVLDAIVNFPTLEAGSSCPHDSMHRCSRLSNINIERIKNSRPDGTWRDWPPHLVVDCHKKLSGKTYPSVYGRMSWDKPSPTITTQFYGYGNGRFGHPKQNRALSLREGATIQGFPRHYKFFKNDKEINCRVAGRLIGNAVPTKLGEWIGKSLMAHLYESYPCQSSNIGG